MYGKKIIEPERSLLGKLARVDYWFIAILGVIAIGVFIAVMLKK